MAEWYPFYVGDYNKKTSHLFLLEHGAYRRLIDHYMSTGRPLPNDDAKLFRICGARNQSERKAVLLAIAEFFTRSESLVIHERCDGELNKQLNFSNSQSAKALLRHCRGNAGDMPARVPTTTTTTFKENITKEKTKPEWIKMEDWNDYLEFRKKKNAPATERAKRECIAELERLKVQGYDPGNVIAQSILRGWIGLFSIRNDFDFNKKTEQRPARQGVKTL